MPNKVTLKANRDKPLRQKHPWVFSGAIDRIDSAVVDGDVVDIVTPQGEFLARGYVNRKSQIAVRVLTWDEQETVDEGFWARRIGLAISWRAMGDHEARRLVNAESDGLPGLIVDRYAEWVIVQALTLGIEKFKPSIVQQLQSILRPAGIYERSDVDVRAKEGLSQISGVLAGVEPPDRVAIEEDGYRYLVDVKHGHKTGFYLDQRENRRKVQAYVDEAAVLNLFSFSGGFAVAALKAGAKSVVNVDSSADALQLAQENLRLNGFTVPETDFVEADVFSYLRQLRAEQHTFDVIIADPPKLAQSQSQIERAARAYKDLNLIALQLLKPGGYLITFSCSGLVPPDLFQKIVFSAAVDAQRDAQIVERLSQASDHPVLLSFPEGEYLKGLVCRVL
ncbi:MAG TPA: class I SAM-dependent rRNA methyltransferase [Anaerolineae bacterium]|nr:class I SAM-dependent rRNA methyltransferase [Anaerolineae bacterium]